MENVRPAAVAGNPEVREGSRLSTMPLAVLLPRLSEVSALQAHAAVFESRLEEIVEDREQGEDDSKERAAEESMLRQVLQWLSVSNNG